MELTFGLLVSLGALFTGYILGRRHNRERLTRAYQRLDVLTNLFTELQTALTRDPTRAGIDIGKEYILNDISNLIDKHREDLRQARIQLQHR